MMIDFTIIVCTFNPDVYLLKRCLESIKQLELDSTFKHEVLLVDNNSTNDFLNNDLLSQVISSQNNLIGLSVKKQGLAYARISGVQEAKSDIIIFVDDDNVLNSKYLVNLSKLLKTFPKVKAWGAGIINVEFVKEPPIWIRKYMMTFFQERYLNTEEFSNEERWQDFYPVGSGMVIKKKEFLAYVNYFNSGEITAIGRTANNLSSGEDSQILWTIIKNKGFIGSSPLLELTHLIPEKRTTLEYLCKLNYELSYSFYKSFYEVFKRDIESYGRIKAKSYISLFIKEILLTKFNILDTIKVFKVKKKWYHGYNAYIDRKK